MHIYIHIAYFFNQVASSFTIRIVFSPLSPAHSTMVNSESESPEATHWF